MSDNIPENNVISNNIAENAAKKNTVNLALAEQTLKRFSSVIEPIEGKSGEYNVRAEALLAVCRGLKAAGFEFLADITAVDYIDREVFRLIYQIGNYQNGDIVVLKTEISREKASTVSVAGIWRSADWLEREVYDMFGITFEGHPNLQRILMWEGFDGWPLRKDFVHKPSSYQGRRQLD